MLCSRQYSYLIFLSTIKCLRKVQCPKISAVVKDFKDEFKDEIREVRVQVRKNNVAQVRVTGPSTRA